jgi:thymidylate synthase
MQKVANGYGAMLHVNNVNEALPLGINLVQECGESVVSRGIETLEVPGPVSTMYLEPTRRVLFDEERDANPFFHLMDAMWMFSGSDCAALPAAFLPTLKQFSDDNGETFHGAYGHRLRHPIDQLKGVVEMLRERPDTRQAVLSIWNPSRDFRAVTKDMPCNDMIMFGIRNGALDMTVCNRSNDVIWGAYGANAVQFSFIQEWVALSVGVRVGRYTQQSNSYHVYPTNPFWLAVEQGYRPTGHVYNPYMEAEYQPKPLLMDATESEYFLNDCSTLNFSAVVKEGQYLLEPTRGLYQSIYFQGVIAPVLRAYGAYKRKDYTGSLELLEDVAADDWKLAMKLWIVRRMERAAAH